VGIINISVKEAEKAVDDLQEKVGEMITDVIDKHIDALVIENFVYTAAGDWMEEDIKDLLTALRDKSEDASAMDLLILYLFIELVDSKKVTLSAVEYYDDVRVSLTDYVDNYVGADCEFGEAKIYSEDSALYLKLADQE
jgi:hypothetical protein